MIRTLLVAWVIAIPAAAAGQTPVDWHMNVSVLDTGDRVNVRTTEGTRLRGRVVRVDADALTLTRDGRELRLSALNMSSIERHDSVWNGGVYGLGAGFATGVVLMSTCDGLGCEHTPQAILSCGALGWRVRLRRGAVVRRDRARGSHGVPAQRPRPGRGGAGNHAYAEGAHRPAGVLRGCARLGQGASYILGVSSRLLFSSSCGSGGTGRRASLRSLFSQESGGSNPLFRTNLRS